MNEGYITAKGVSYDVQCNSETRLRADHFRIRVNHNTDIGYDMDTDMLRN